MDPYSTNLKSHGPDGIWIHNTKKRTSDFLPLSNLLQLVLKASQPLLRSYSKKKPIKNFILTLWQYDLKINRKQQTTADISVADPIPDPGSRGQKGTGSATLADIRQKSFLKVYFSLARVCLLRVLCHLSTSWPISFFFDRDDQISNKENCRFSQQIGLCTTQATHLSFT